MSQNIKQSKNRTAAYGVSTAGIIAALYVVLTYVSELFNLSGGMIQLRLSEALTVLPFFTPYAVPGLFIGCLLANFITGCVLYDTLFGSLATLVGALGTLLISRHAKGKKWVRFAAPIPTIISNTLVVPFILSYVYGLQEAIGIIMISVGTGELLSAGILGNILMLSLYKYRNVLFKTKE